MRQIFPLLLVLLLQGCVMQVRQTDTSGMATYDGVSADFPGDAQFLATMATGELGHRYPPGRTTLILASTKTAFGQELESALRQQGFAVSQHSAPAGIKVGYTLDVLRDESPPTTCYLQVRTSDGQTFGQVRTLSMASLDVTAPSQIPSQPPLESSTLPDEPTPTPSPGQPQPHPERLMPSSRVEGKPAPVPVASLTRSDGVPVRIKATAARIAKRNRVPVADFCRWNNVEPETIMESGRRVYLRGDAVVPASPVNAEAAPPATSKERPAKPLESSSPAPIAAPAPVPLPTQTSTPSDSMSEFKTPVSAPVKPVVPASVPEGAPPASSSAPASPVQEALADLAPKGSEAEPSSMAPAVPMPTWTINPGSLHAQLESWSFKAQYQLVWKAKHDFELETKANFSGDFVVAIKQLFAGLHRGGHALRVTVYQGNNVIEVAED